MLSRNSLLLVAGAALFTLASVASAQDTTRTRPRSQRRIPVTKEAPGEVELRVDTVTIYQTDTLRMERVDTVTRTRTVTHYDTVTQIVTVPPRLIGGLYFGLAGGTNFPAGGLRSVQNPAATGQLQVGYQGLNSWIGGRLDVQFNQFSQSVPFADLAPNPDVWNFMLNAKINIPIAPHLFGSSAVFTPYLLGGGGGVAFRNLRIQQDFPAPIINNNDLRDPDPFLLDGSWHGDWAWDAGGGLGVHFRRTEVFVESRIISFSRGSDENGFDLRRADQVPLVFGVNFY